MKAILFRGRKDNIYRSDGPTQADAIAESWEEVPAIISDWNRELGIRN
jgi:hypothetical protein